MIVIIGGGLSGLLSGYRLKKKGIPFIILEARSRLGGRINTVSAKDNTPIEMGATWFGKQHVHLIALLKELEIESFEQFMKGTAFYQPDKATPLQAIQLPEQEPNYRISGGSCTLINKLTSFVKEEITLNESVSEITIEADKILVKGKKIYEAQKVILALPPRLWSNNIRFNPSLPFELTKTASETQTWMDDSIKVGLAYKQPFWKAVNQSGTLFSNAGPLVEFYDHCNVEEHKFALCGFLDRRYGVITLEERKAIITKQLIEAFGEKAAKFIDYQECHWSKEPFTSIESNTPLFPHQNNGNLIFQKPLFDNRVFISSSEVSSQYGGYMDGAVYSTNQVINRI